MFTPLKFFVCISVMASTALAVAISGSIHHGAAPGLKVANDMKDLGINNKQLHSDTVNAAGVRFCTNANFSGVCAHVTGFRSGACVPVGSNFNDDVSSFGPGSGLTCTIYSDAGCKGRSIGGVISPGISNLADYNINDMMSSFSCKY